MTKKLLIPVVFSLCFSFFKNAALATEKDIPTAKRTTLDLYLTAAEAHQFLQGNSQAKLIDIRTPEEYVYVGHAPNAINIPEWFMDYGYDARKNRQKMIRNESFVAQVKELFALDDTLLVICRSGKRSGKSVDALAAAGFTKVYNIIDGFEGDLEKDKQSPHYGRRTVNGWKNSGLPWTYDLDPDLMYQGHRSHPTSKLN